MIRIQSRRVDVKGTNIHYYTGGEGEPLIIIHGGGGGARTWRRNIAVLSKKYKIYAPDLPGFGLSPYSEASYYYPDMAEFINDFADSLGLKKFYLMGHSFGGGIAAHYALAHPQRIRKLVLVSSLCMGNEIAFWIRLFSNPVICRALGKAAISLFKAIKYVARFFGPWEIVEPVTKASVQMGGYVATFTTQTIVLLSQLPKIMVPTLVVWGARCDSTFMACLLCGRANTGLPGKGL